MDTRQLSDTGSEQKGYKRHWVKWVGLYLAIGAIVYFIIYLVAFHHGGGGAGGDGY